MESHGNLESSLGTLVRQTCPRDVYQEPLSKFRKKKKTDDIFFLSSSIFFFLILVRPSNEMVQNSKTNFITIHFDFFFQRKEGLLGFLCFKKFKEWVFIHLIHLWAFFFLLIVTRSRDNALQCMYKWPCCWYDKMPRGVYKSKFIFNFLYNTGLQHENYMSLFISLILPLPKLLQCDRYMYTQRRNSRFKWREKGGKTRMQVDRHLFLWVAVKHYRTLASYVSYSCCSRFFTIKKKKKCGQRT